MACDCIETVNKGLREKNATLLFTLFGKPNRVVIETAKIESKVRGKPPAMIASFCPFCGESYAASPQPRSDKEGG